VLCSPMGGSGKGKRRRRLPARGGGLLWAGIWVLLLLTTIIVGTVTLNRIRLGRSRLGKCPAVAADCGPCARTRALLVVPRPLTTRRVAGIPWSNVCECLGYAELCDDCHGNLSLGGAWNDVMHPCPEICSCAPHSMLGKRSRSVFLVDYVLYIPHQRAQPS